MSNASDDDEGAGWGKPPKHSRFKPGNSGNPKGRPAKPRGVAEAVARHLDKPMRVRVGGRARRITKREVLVHQLFERACELNDASGCHWLSLAVHHGHEGLYEANEARSAHLMEKACNLGDQEACWILGNFYLWGTRRGVIRPDPRRAASIYEKACAAGEAASCDILGQCYEQGMGVPKNPAQGRKLRKRAKELGFVGE